PAAGGCCDRSSPEKSGLRPGHEHQLADPESPRRHRSSGVFTVGNWRAARRLEKVHGRQSGGSYEHRRMPANRRQDRILQVLGGGCVLPCHRVIHSPRISRLKSTAMKRVLCSIAILLFLFRAAEGGPAYSSAEQKIF